MPKRSAKVIPMPIRQRLVCSECGADGEGTCRCGAAYVPAGQRAAKAVAANPAKSDRAIADDIGVDHKTVAKARKMAAGEHSPPAKRTGSDGKSYPATVERKASPTVVVGGEPVSPTVARQVAQATQKLAALPIRDQVNAFIRELTDFENDFAMRLLAWHETSPRLSSEAQHALVLFLSNFSMRMQKVAQKIDGR
jgi:hypothetical protein